LFAAGGLSIFSSWVW